MRANPKFFERLLLQMHIYLKLGLAFKGASINHVDKEGAGELAKCPDYYIVQYISLI